VLYVAQIKHPSIHPYRLPVPSSAVPVPEPEPEPARACLHCDCNDQGAQRRRRRHAAPLAGLIILTFLPSLRRPQRYVWWTSSAAPASRRAGSMSISIYLYACRSAPCLLCVIYIYFGMASCYPIQTATSICFIKLQLCI